MKSRAAEPGTAGCQPAPAAAGTRAAPADRRSHGGDGREAVGALARVPYDLVLMDCYMPQMDGYAATAEIRRREEAAGPASPRTSIIAITANALAGDDEVCFAAGMDDYIPKPIDPAHLKAVLARWIAPATPTAADGAEVVDATVLDALRDLQDEGQPDILAELVEMYLRDTPPRLAAIRDAGARADGVALGRDSHSLKGSSSAIGAVEVARLCAELEEQAALARFEQAADTPQALDAAFDRARPPARADWNGERGMNVLIAEDDATTRIILQRSVEVCGHACLAARDGLEAWDLYQQAGADVIISDWLMPGIDGVELCRRVRAHTGHSGHATPYTYVIILTGLGDREHMRAAMEVGADDYLAKPLNREDLRMRLSVADRVTAVYRRLVVQQAELERSNGELQQFAYVASHDLQEPLRTVKSYLQLLTRRYKGKLGADADEFIGYAVDGAGRMTGLIEDLLAYSRVSTRGEEFAATDCAVLVDDVLAGLHAAIDESGATVTHEGLPTVLADASQLGQLFQNLICNALKFNGGRRPEVRIWAEHADGEWLFAVRDNGIGLEQGYAERIFVIFQRLHTREEYPGSGLGLAICKKIVERHGGRIWVESRAGAGATFRFTLPAVPARGETAA